MLSYVAFSVQSPFLPALLREQGLRAEAIGILLPASTQSASLPDLRLVMSPIGYGGTH
jgi:hypothetical protein